MALSARNLLKGKIKEVKKGMVMAEVTIEGCSWSGRCVRYHHQFS
nr:hypothetical protein [uncultured Desulfobulbus sp.]